MENYRLLKKSRFSGRETREEAAAVNSAKCSSVKKRGVAGKATVAIKSVTLLLRAEILQVAKGRSKRADIKQNVIVCSCINEKSELFINTNTKKMNEENLICHLIVSNLSKRCFYTIKYDQFS